VVVVVVVVVVVWVVWMVWVVSCLPCYPYCSDVLYVFFSLTQVLDPEHRPDMSGFEGCLGYASDLFVLRPEHEFLRRAVFHNLFGCFVVFDTTVLANQAWQQCQRNHTFGESSVSFLALDTYDDVVLSNGNACVQHGTSTTGGTTLPVWTWDDSFYNKEHKPDVTNGMRKQYMEAKQEGSARGMPMHRAIGEGGEEKDEGKDEGKDEDHPRRHNPFSVASTSNMMTADEKRARLTKTTTQAVCVFAHGTTFRTSNRTARDKTRLRMEQLLAWKRELVNVVQGGNPGCKNPVPGVVLEREGMGCKV
jgi:hypothetical protein